MEGPFDSLNSNENFPSGSDTQDATAHVETGPEMELEKEAIANLVDTFQKLYYGRSMVTAESRFARSEKHPDGRERPLYLRGRRAKLYKTIREIPEEEKESRKEIIEKARLRDDIAERFLNQQDLKVNFPEYGELSARMVDIHPPQSLITPETENLPPVFVIPGLSNDIDCVNNMVCEIAMQGRRVATLGYPESYKGHTTEAFADAVEKDGGFGPHTAFYGAAIEHIFGKDQPVELWGFSTGAPIVSHLLNDPRFQDRTSKAARICPAAAVDQSLGSLKRGAVSDIAFTESGSMIYSIWGKKELNKEQQKLHDRINGSLFKAIIKKDDSWKTARVHEGGNIVVVSGGKDKITKSADRNAEFETNPQIDLLRVPNGYHMSPQSDAETIIPQIMQQ